MDSLPGAIAPAWPRTVAETIVADRGLGARLETSDGRTFLDFTSGIGVTNTGHCHPRVVAAIQEQAAQIVHAQTNICYSDALVGLTNRLRDLTPDAVDSFFFANSGAEAVEGAVKLAKQATGRSNVIVFQGSFHGRTHMTMSMTTSKTMFRAGYQPLVPGVFVAPFPYAYRYGWDDDTTIDFCLNELELLLTGQTAPEETAAVVIEPVLGEGGYVVPPRRFMQELRALCDRNDILLVADEIQTGFGRTGRWFGMQHYGIDADVVVMGKGMSSGMPISAIGAPRELWDTQRPGSHGGTFGGNAVACAAAVATIDVLREEGLVEKAAENGGYLLEGLRALGASHPEIGDVRGLGMMLATEFTSPDGDPWTSRAKAVADVAFAEGLMLLRCGTHGNVVRWIPPLTVGRDDIDEALGTFASALSRTAASSSEYAGVPAGAK